ncbi:MAG: MBL fold metallo-hydrolase [Oscillospiraceae bacterium]|nr:MBL fold metallo-hydrolase [Oscillospiraceae bacterium]
MIGKIMEDLYPVTTSADFSIGDINYYAQGGVSCYVIKGENGDLLIDTGLFNIWKGLSEWLKGFDIRYILLTHAHADHDWNVSKLQSNGIKVFLSIKDRGLRRNYLSQPVCPTSSKYIPRNIEQWIVGSVFNSPPYDADIYFDVNDRDILSRYGFKAKVIALPGHTYGSVGVYHKGTLYCGDAFTALWGKPEITPHAVDIKMMKHSLKRMLRLSPERLACGHGLPFSFDEAVPVIEEYLYKESRR